MLPITSMWIAIARSMFFYSKILFHSHRFIWIDRLDSDGHERLSQRWSEKGADRPVTWSERLGFLIEYTRFVYDVLWLDVSHANRLVVPVEVFNIFFLSFVSSYPDYTPILIRAVELWAHDPAVTTPVLKLFSELVQNRSQRLQFEVSSPNGILLFREASKIICCYGKCYGCMFGQEFFFKLKKQVEKLSLESED